MKKLNKLSTAIIYTRVSSQDQLQGFSLDSQEKICKEFAVKNNLEVIKVFREEGESAKNTDRTMLQEMMRYISINRNKIGSLVIYKVDRLARKNTDYYALKALFNSYGVQVVSATEALTENPAGKFLESILAGVAEFDNNVRTERTVGGMQQALQTGYWPFKAPFGYSNSKHDRKSSHSIISINPETAPLVKFIFTEYVKNIYTFRELAKKTTKLTNGKYNITPQNLIKILKNPFYYGQVEVADWEISAKGNHEPIISRELFERAKIIQSGGNPHKNPRNRHHPDFPLRGLLCRCGYTFTGGWTRGKQGKRYAYYNCSKKECEDRTGIAKKLFETQFTSYLEQLTPIETNLEILAEAVKLSFKQEAGLMITNHNKLELEIRQLRNRKDKLLELKLSDGAIISDEDFKTNNIKLDNQIQKLELAMLDANSSNFNVAGAIDFAFALIKNLPNVWQEIDVVDFKALRAILFPENLTYQYPNFQTPTLPFVYSIDMSLSNEKETLVALTELNSKPILELLGKLSSFQEAYKELINTE